MQNCNIPRTAAVALVLSLAACGGDDVRTGGTHLPPSPPPQTSLTPEQHLQTPRFRIHQPRVLEQVGAHHAYAKGLTGQGVTIGIEDTIVDYTQREEFEDRVQTDDSAGASLVYWRPPGRQKSFDAALCQLNPRCVVYTIDSEGEENAYNEAVREIVRRDGWPIADDEAYIIDVHYSEHDPIGRLYRAWEVPTPYGPIREKNWHGTVVASTAAGRHLGVASSATVIPVAKNLTDDQKDEILVAQEIISLVRLLPDEERTRVDEIVASEQRNEYRRFDIINRSYGSEAPPDPVTDTATINEIDAFLSAYLPTTRRALLQLDRPAEERTVIVYAAGNEGHERPDKDAALAYYMPEVRGYRIAVVATDTSTQRIADRRVNGIYDSDRCGPVPSDWDPRTHGPHFCITAPGTVRGLIPDPRAPGRGNIQGGIGGTSFAAPVVSGALALMMEHFRGTRGNTAVVKRMLDTADRTGEYADLETYGAGHLDLEAALSPVGSLNTGQERHALSDTRLSLPAAFGSLGSQMESLEVAAFDEQEFPFWVPVSGLVSMRETGRSPVPELETPQRVKAPGAGLEALGLHWTPTSTRVPGEAAAGRMWVAGFGPSSASLARVPTEDAWGYGLSFSDGEYLGGRAAGAFGSNLRSGMIWSSRSVRQEIGKDWSIEATGTLALSGPYYEENAIFEASPSMLSAASVRVGTRATGLTLEQPLRAESGTGTLRLENGELKNGQRRYDEHRVRLEPDAREIRATLRHEREAAGGSIAVQVVGAFNANHTTGQSWTGAGVAYRKIW